DSFFGIGNSLKDLLPQIDKFWPDAGTIHIDSWRAITVVDTFGIKVLPKSEATVNSLHKLFFLNLGGYKPGDLEEYHYKLLTIAADKSEAIAKAKKTAFFMHTGFKGATSHIDDKYGVDVDDVYEIVDILPEALKSQYSIEIEEMGLPLTEDQLHIGYLKLSSL
ncbi:MAG: DUF1543 domain-containing protein, partial [Ferruginibacter sp.]